MPPNHLRTPTKYLAPPPGYRFRPPWYADPRVYVPVAVVALFVGAMVIYFSIVAASLRREAATFDLGRLEQM